MLRKLRCELLDLAEGANQRAQRRLRGVQFGIDVGFHLLREIAFALFAVDLVLPFQESCTSLCTIILM